MRFAGLIAAVVLAGANPSRADAPKIDPRKLPAAAAGKIDFATDIKPILTRSCIECHGPDKQRGGLRLDEGAAALKGSNSGVVIVPGKGADSRLLHLVAGLDPDLRMPPKEKPALTKAEIGTLRAWIEQGAAWPRETTAVVAAKSRHWAFQPIARPALPPLKGTGWVHNDIDAFVLARLEKEGLAPSPEADRVTLIRRLHLDLLGLPPAPGDVDRFVNDKNPDAYEKLVDRVLSSPHYGERWGRHWLDLARYADSDGYEQDRPRPFAWRYRNWVIDALNRDMPFDQFTVEQLAGDLLPDAGIEQKTATGFHRNTLTNREGGTDKEQFRVEACFDRVNTTAKAFLGLTLGCAQCHDHKYDPFSQREYYQFFAFFNSDEEVETPAPLPGDDSYAKAKAAFDKTKAELESAIAAHKKEAVKADPKLAELQKTLAAHLKKAPTTPVVPTLTLGKGRKTHVMLRGDFLRPGIEVQAATPAVLHAPTSQAHGRRSVGTGPTGPTRLDLAHWIVDPANPLTARVITNWVWNRYFGRGLVATLEDFGTQGENPSHPELLDYLASEFVHGRKWSLKELHKLIVTSATYRQSSKLRPELTTRDPYNMLLGRQSRLRLEAEILRDNALAVSGLLNRAIGGPSVKPPQPAGISELTYANTAKWVESKGGDRLRRGMYTWFQRTSPHPMLTTFDAPDGILCCVRREKSNTPLQALTLLNDTTFVECAQALARRIMNEQPGSTSLRLRHAFRLCLARAPTAAEETVLTGLHADLVALGRANPKEAVRLGGPAGSRDSAEAAAWVAVARMLLNLDEFVTRE